VPTDTVRRRRLIRVLGEDPDLGCHLDRDDVALATRQTVGFLEEVPRGAWRRSEELDGRSLYGGLVLSGLFVRELTIGSGTTAELLGAGEVILARDLDGEAPFVNSRVAWTALEPTRVAWLDAPFGLAVRRWPELAAALLERSQQRSHRLALSQAVSQLTRVDERVLVLLWHLGERWGRVRPDGVLLPMRLTHRVIARLIGARRPSVTTAIGQLEEEGRLARLEGGVAPARRRRGARGRARARALAQQPHADPRVGAPARGALAGDRPPAARRAGPPDVAVAP
jgi:CRP/FNR family transcriptional regulator, cyclic AMP receptor protein